MLWQNCEMASRSNLRSSVNNTYLHQISHQNKIRRTSFLYC